MTDIKNLKEKLIEYSEKQYESYFYNTHSYGQGLLEGFEDAISLLEECLEALEFYSNKDGYNYGCVRCVCHTGNTDIIEDKGETSRQALQNLEKKISEEK